MSGPAKQQKPEPHKPSGTFDIVIAGGGMAGLSLAVRLISPSFAGLRIAVIEPRTSYSRDRTWCSFGLPGYAHPFAEAVSARWNHWVVRRDAASRHICSDTQIAYEMIEAGDFYSVALAAISQANHIEMFQGVSVEKIARSHAQPDSVSVETSIGKLEARLVFDSRPQGTPSKGAWIQEFQGIELHSSSPLFDPSRAMMMDFSVMTDADARAGRVHFMYLLPKSPTCALIEDTWFISANDHALRPDMAANIRRYLAQHFAHATFRDGYRESGRLIMDATLRPSMLAGRHLQIGAAGGMARAASGYAFFETQRACELIAARLRETFVSDKTRPPFVLPRIRSDLSYWMDGVFLRALQHAPEMAPELFFNLFRSVPTASLARFLSGVANAHDVLRVIAACPKLPFLRAGVPL
jgi:lycopene beta-cyclase